MKIIIYICRKRWKVKQIDKMIDVQDFINSVIQKHTHLDNFDFVDIECRECKCQKKQCKGGEL